MILLLFYLMVNPSLYNLQQFYFMQLKLIGEWSEDRFREVEQRLSPFLKSCGYNPKKDITFVPISALSGNNVKDSVPEKICPWWTQGSLFNVSLSSLLVCFVLNVSLCRF